MVEEKTKPTPLARRIDGDEKTHDHSGSHGKTHLRQGIGGTLGHQPGSRVPSTTTIHAQVGAADAARLAAHDASGVRGDGRTGPRDEDDGSTTRTDGGSRICGPVRHADRTSAATTQRSALVPLVSLGQYPYQTDYYAPTSGRALFSRLCDWVARAVRS